MKTVGGSTMWGVIGKFLLMAAVIVAIVMVSKAIR